jgi:hypothetical protein
MNIDTHDQLRKVNDKLVSEHRRSLFQQQAIRKMTNQINEL